MPKIVNHEARRNDISAIAAGLISAGGLEGATIREIARASGYSKGVVEHYFENKGELIAGALGWVNQCYETRVEEATRGLSGIEALRQRIESTLPIGNSVRDEWKVRLVFWSMAAIEENLRLAQAARFRKAVTFFEGDVTDAMAAGELRSTLSPGVIARRLVNATTGLSIAALHDKASGSRSFLISEVEQLLSVYR